MPFENVDFFNSPAFGAQESGDGMVGIGSGNGLDWGVDWASLDPSLVSRYEGMDGPYRGQETSYLNKDALLNYLTKNNANVVENQLPGGAWRGVRDNSGKWLADPRYITTAPDWVDNTIFTLGSMFLSPFGGIAAGGAEGGLGGSLSSGTTARAINSGVGGAASAAGANASGTDIVRAGLTGAAGAGMPNVAGYAGIDNPNLQSSVNSGLRAGGVAALNRGNVGASALMGALPGLVDFGKDTFAGMPDEGTLGGTMQDQYGESSATLGGTGPEAQAIANEQVAGAQEPSFSDKVMKALGVDNNFQLPSFTGKQVGDFAQGLAGLYEGFQRRKQARDLMRMVGANRSAYADNLRRTLSRKDAASGRRSDYAGRETQLQAELARLDANNMPGILNLQNASLSGLGNILRSGLSMANNFGLFGQQQQPSVSYTGQLPGLNSIGSTDSTNYSLDPAAFKRKLGGGI